MGIDATDKNFEESIKEGLVIVDFWASWCAPCKALTPLLEEIDKEHDEVKVVKVNVDENQKTAMAHQVMSIPTVKFFKDGQEVGTYIGLQPKDVYVEAIKQNS